MIERKFVAQNKKEFQIREYISATVGKAGLSNVKLQRTPLGEKILISASRPGLIVGRAGSNITRLTHELKSKFDLENPQIEIEEVPNPNLDANIIAEGIVNSLERFGPARFKGIGHKAMSDVMSAGGLGVEIIISGKIPSSRAKSWRFYKGYLKKCGDVVESGISKAYSTANLKTGAIGVQVRIMPPTTMLPDKIKMLDEQPDVAQSKEPEKAENPEGKPEQKEAEKQAEPKVKKESKASKTKKAKKADA
jgi:small subunit ribosomal protein S3